MTFNEYLDFELKEMSSERVEARFPVKEEYMNELGSIHGAIIMAIADVVTGFLAIDFKYLAPTQSSYTNFLRPILETEYIYAKSKVIKRGSRTVTLDCEIWGDDGKLAAINRTECTIIDKSVAENPSPLIQKIKNGEYKSY